MGEPTIEPTFYIFLPMKVLLLALVSLFFVALGAGWLRARNLRRRVQRGELAEEPTIRRARPEGCCGQHAVCEKEMMLKTVGKPIEYYEDEELDAYRGRPADAYTSEEEEQFEEVLTTMRQDEVAGWLRSLQLRGINLPLALRDEVMMLVSE